MDVPPQSTSLTKETAEQRTPNGVAEAQSSSLVESHGATEGAAAHVVSWEGVPPMGSVCDPGRGLMMVRVAEEET